MNENKLGFADNVNVRTVTKPTSTAASGSDVCRQAQTILKRECLANQRQKTATIKQHCYGRTPPHNEPISDTDGNARDFIQEFKQMKLDSNAQSMIEHTDSETEIAVETSHENAEAFTRIKTKANETDSENQVKIAPTDDSSDAETSEQGKAFIAVEQLTNIVDTQTAQTSPIAVITKEHTH